MTRWICVKCNAERKISDRWCPKCGNTVYRPIYGSRPHLGAKDEERLDTGKEW